MDENKPGASDWFCEQLNEDDFAWPSREQRLISEAGNAYDTAWLHKGWSSYAEGYYQMAQIGCQKILEAEYRGQHELLIFENQ